MHLLIDKIPIVKAYHEDAVNLIILIGRLEESNKNMDRKLLMVSLMRIISQIGHSSTTICKCGKKVAEQDIGEMKEVTWRPGASSDGYRILIKGANNCECWSKHMSKECNNRRGLGCDE